MPIPNVSTLYERIHKGSEGGHEFARILNLLFIADQNSGGIKFQNSSDASGDYKGVDGIIFKQEENIGVQYKFYPIPFSPQHKSEIKKSLETAINKFPEMNKWRLITPHTPNKHSMEWIDKLSDKFNITIEHWGHDNIMELMLKYPHIGCQYYSEIVTKSNSPLTIESAQDYFEQFINPKSDIAILFSNAQPSVADCKIVFNQKFYKEISDRYHSSYRDQIESYFEINYLAYKTKVEVKSYTTEDIRNQRDNLPGGMRQILQKYDALQPNITFYAIKFMDNGKDSGISYSVWCYLNNRWILFFKPWKILSSIDSIKEIN